MNNNQSNNNTIIWAGVALVAIIVLALFGWRISNVTIPVGPVQVSMQNPGTANSQEVQPVSPTSVPPPTAEPVQSTQPAPEIQDFNPSLSLPFSDNFDNGLNPEWRVMSGSPVVVGGKLQTLEELTIEIGNNNLTSYQLDFDCCGGSSGQTTVTIGRKLRFWFNDCGVNCGYGGWEGYSNDTWQKLERFDLMGTPGHFTIIVSGSTCQLYAKTGLVSEITFIALNGPVSITLTKEAVSPEIDDLVIK